MITGLPKLESTDWSKLHHAYGRATDTPGHLSALLEHNPETCKAAISHLWSAIIHQGTPWTATGPVALVVAGFLSDMQLNLEESIRVELVAFLVSVAEVHKQTDCPLEELERLAGYDITSYIETGDDEGLYDNEDAANALYARSILDCINAAPVLMEVMLGVLSSNNLRVRRHAAMGAVELAKIEALGHYARDIETKLLAMVQTSASIDERCALLLALGDMGYSTIAFLDDPSAAIRMCAALSPNLATHPTAIKELLNTLEQHAGQIDGWFNEKPPQFSMRPRFAVVKRLIQQVKNFDQLVDAAIAVIQVTTKSCVDYDWGPFLSAAFPKGNGIITTAAQRRYLLTLTNKTELWDSTFGNALIWFKKAGLPYDRKQCLKRIEGS